MLGYSESKRFQDRSLTYNIPRSYKVKVDFIVSLKAIPFLQVRIASQIGPKSGPFDREGLLEPSPEGLFGQINRTQSIREEALRFLRKRGVSQSIVA